MLPKIKKKEKEEHIWCRYSNNGGNVDLDVADYVFVKEKKIKEENIQRWNIHWHDITYSKILSHFLLHSIFL